MVSKGDFSGWKVARRLLRTRTQLHQIKVAERSSRRNWESYRTFGKECAAAGKIRPSFVLQRSQQSWEGSAKLSRHSQERVNHFWFRHFGAEREPADETKEDVWWSICNQLAHRFVQTFLPVKLHSWRGEQSKVLPRFVALLENTAF